jgi:hypothetical protein
MNKFDRILWRINGTFFLAILLFGIFSFVRELTFHAHTPVPETAIVNDVSASPEKEFLHFGLLSRITGTSLARIPLNSEGSSRKSSFSSGYSESCTRNFLLIDYSDLSSWWLFDGFQQAILKEHDLRAEPDGKDKRIIGTIFEVATVDTNGDQRVSSNDRISVFFTGADGKKPIEIVSPSDRILSVDQVTNNEVLVTYQRGIAATAVLFSAQSDAKIKEAPLAIKENN